MESSLSLNEECDDLFRRDDYLFDDSYYPTWLSKTLMGIVLYSDIEQSDFSLSVRFEIVPKLFWSSSFSCSSSFVSILSYCEMKRFLWPSEFFETLILFKLVDLISGTLLLNRWIAFFLFELLNDLKQFLYRVSLLCSYKSSPWSESKPRVDRLFVDFFYLLFFS